MPKTCQITGAHVTVGHRIHRSGKAKKEGGIGKHITKRVKRRIYANIKTKRIWVPELAEFVKVKLTMRALKTINKNGAYKTLLKAGLIKPAAPKQKAAATPAKA
jgi:large subunit ribosomal protein L28